MSAAFEDWTFVADLGVAVGTLGAVVVALWLARKAARDARDAEAASRRQIFAVWQRGDGTGSSYIEAVNGSTEVMLFGGPGTHAEIFHCYRSFVAGRH